MSTLGLWSESVAGENVAPWVLRFKQVVRGRCTPWVHGSNRWLGERCQTLGLWFETGSRGECQPPGLAGSKQVVGSWLSSARGATSR